MRKVVLLVAALVVTLGRDGVERDVGLVRDGDHRPDDHDRRKRSR